MRIWLYVFGILALVCGVLASFAEPEHVLFHLLIELAVAFAFIVVTVLIVEQVLEHQRKRDRLEYWSEVCDHAVLLLWSSITQTTSFAFSLFLDQETRAANLEIQHTVLSALSNPTPHTVNAMSATLKLLETAIGAMPEDAELTDKVATWMTFAKPRFEYIRYAIIPLLHQSTDDRALNRHMIELDSIAYWLDGKLDMLQIGTAKEAIASAVASDLLDIVRKCAVIVHATLAYRQRPNQRAA